MKPPRWLRFGTADFWLALAGLALFLDGLLIGHSL